MNQIQRKKRARYLEYFLGDYVSIQLKNMTIVEGLDNETISINNSITGYVTDVNDYYIYLGDKLEEYHTAIEIDEVGIIKIIEVIPPELQVVVPEDKNVH